MLQGVGYIGPDRAAADAAVTAAGGVIDPKNSSQQTAGILLEYEQ